MGHRLSKIYTRTGDTGTTGLGSGERVPKDHARVEAFGNVDELNSTIGMVLACANIQSNIKTCLVEIQHDLFDLGGELCMPELTLVDDGFIERLEKDLDGFNADLPPLKEFILPGGGQAASACHLARTVCRRAERRVWSLAHIDKVNEAVPRYLNRLSDLLFVIARVLARAEQGQEVLWRRGKA
ncbi:MAG: cob(I)yrinic acid a,c-diamide adenosyltransferase [Gammaproteobacteria bacterium]